MSNILYLFFRTQTFATHVQTFATKLWYVLTFATHVQTFATNFWYAQTFAAHGTTHVQTFQTQTLGATMQFGSKSGCGATLKV